MPRQDVIKVEGVVTAVLTNTVCQVELANGHRLLAHVPARKRAGFAGLSQGSKVEVEVSPFDLSKGRLVVVGSEHESSRIS